MRALTFNGSFQYRTDYQAPRLIPSESLVRVRLAGICGTDLEVARGYMAFRGVPGHEFVGEVIDSARQDLVGKRVVGEINAGCGRASCRWCAASMQRHCPDRTVLGILGRDGAFADILSLPDENLIVVPDSVPDRLAVFTEPLAAAYEIFSQIHIPRDCSILVLGDGRLGALIALALTAEAYSPTLAGRHQEKLERLGALGLNTRLETELKSKFDYVVDCTGRGEGFRRAIGLVKPRGTIVLKSTAAASADLNLAPIVIDEISIVGSRCGLFAPALAAIASGKVNPAPLIDGEFPLSEWDSAFEAARQHSNFKILLRPS